MRKSNEILNVSRNAVEQFDGLTTETIKTVYQTLLQGVESEGIDRQREIKDRIECVGKLDGLCGYTEWVSAMLLKEAQKNNDLP